MSFQKILSLRKKTAPLSKTGSSDCKELMIPEALIQRILKDYALPLDGIHGISHWGRVLETSLRLAQHTGAKVEVGQLFAVFHDAKRVNEGVDFDHGRRGADFAASLRGSLFNLSAKDFDLLYAACAYHTDGLTDGNITVQTCWDADRLDLGRAGITPLLQYLGTEAAKDPQLIRWADERSQKRSVPDVVRREWAWGDKAYL